jgi:hypothetical protein
VKRSPITPRQAAKRLAEITEKKRALKAARSARRRAKAAANTKSHKAPRITEHTGKKRRVRQVSYRILSETELGVQPSGDLTELADLEVGE